MATVEAVPAEAPFDAPLKPGDIHSAGQMAGGASFFGKLLDVTDVRCASTIRLVRSDRRICQISIVDAKPNDNEMTRTDTKREDRGGVAAAGYRMRAGVREDLCGLLTTKVL